LLWTMWSVSPLYDDQMAWHAYFIFMKSWHAYFIFMKSKDKTSRPSPHFVLYNPHLAGRLYRPKSLICWIVCYSRRKEVVCKLVKEMPLGCYTVLIFWYCSTPRYSHHNPQDEPVFLAMCREILEWCSQTMKLTTNLLW
jgi:hypothetical protein